MKAAHIELLTIIQKNQPSIAFPLLVEKAHKQGVLLDQTEEIKPDAYRKRVERELVAILCIKLINIPLEKGEGNPVYYALPSDFKIPASEIDITLAMVLHFSKRVFSNVLPETQKAQLKDYYSVAESLFETDREAKRYRNFIDSIAWYPEGYGNRLIQDSEKIIGSKQLTLLSEALYRRRKIRVEYESRYNNTVSTMDISPFGLVLRGHVIYLVAGYTSRGEYQYRHLHSGRFASIVILDEEPVIPNQFDLNTYLDDGAFEKDHFQELPEQMIELRIVNHLKLLFEERVTGSVIKETGNGLVVTFSEKPYPEFIWWLLSFGSQLEVLKPLDLREKIKSEIGVMNKNYN